MPADQPHEGHLCANSFMPGGEPCAESLNSVGCATLQEQLLPSHRKATGESDRARHDCQYIDVANGLYDSLDSGVSNLFASTLEDGRLCSSDRASYVGVTESFSAQCLVKFVVSQILEDSAGDRQCKDARGPRSVPNC